MMTFPLSLKIIDIIHEIDNCKTFVFHKPDNFSYQAGQYLTIQISDSLAETRSYSFSSAPHENHLSITIKRVENGLYSRWALQNVEVGDEIRAVGVYGTFVPQGTDKDYIMFAAGSGIVPVYSIIKSLLHSDKACHIRLHYSSSNPENTIFYKEINELLSGHPNFQVSYYFSQSLTTAPKRLGNFDIPGLIDGHHDSSCLYICGPVDYMDVIQINARTHGFKPENIFKEDYLAYYEDGYEGEDKDIPADTQAHQVTIYIHDTKHVLTVQYPKSILETALEAGIALPYSCFSGQCGNCTAQKIAGDIFMAYNQVLTEDDIKKGLILTCQGFAVNGNAEIRY